MQSIELRTDTPLDSRWTTVTPAGATQSVNCTPDLDDALAKLLQAVKATQNPEDMNALGTLLAYMEQLERQQTKPAPKAQKVWLEKPSTLTL